MAELEAMQSRPSQYNPGNEVPEKNWVYRFVKKHWFNDFGAYANFRPSESPDNGNGTTGAELTSAAAETE